jgi:hypothetical protein
MLLKEIAKFASGVTAWEAVVHASLALSGQLPITLFGITITSDVNTIQIVVPAIISILLAYYAWSRK